MTAGMLIVGAGLAGLTVAEALRAEGYAGPLTLLGEEAQPPYHRPPLSKGYLLGETPEAQLAMRAPELLAKRNIALETGVRVTAIDRSARQLTLADGSRRAYAGLALCTGSRPRRLTLAGADAVGIHTLRTLADARAIDLVGDIADMAVEQARDIARRDGGAFAVALHFLPGCNGRQADHQGHKEGHNECIGQPFGRPFQH